MRKRRVAGLAAVVVTASALALVPGVANAAGPGGAETCPSGNFCLYYNSPGNNWGSFEHFSSGRWDLSQFTFRDWGNGSGYDQVIYHNAASVVNNSGHQWLVTGQTVNGYKAYLVPDNWAGALPADMQNHDEWIYVYS